MAAKSRGRLSKNLDRVPGVLAGTTLAWATAEAERIERQRANRTLPKHLTLQGRPPRKKLLNAPGVKPRHSCIRYVY